MVNNSSTDLIHGALRKGGLGRDGWDGFVPMAGKIRRKTLFGIGKNPTGYVGMGLASPGMGKCK